MMSTPRLPLAILLAVLPLAAAAQPLRSVVVGSDVQVVVPPRGAAPLPLARLQAALQTPQVPLPVASASLGLSAAIPALLPVAAALLLGAGSPGSGGAAGAPARTR